MPVTDEPPVVEVVDVPVCCEVVPDGLVDVSTEEDVPVPADETPEVVLEATVW